MWGKTWTSLGFHDRRKWDAGAARPWHLWADKRCPHEVPRTYVSRTSSRRLMDKLKWKLLCGSVFRKTTQITAVKILRIDSTQNNEWGIIPFKWDNLVRRGLFQIIRTHEKPLIVNWADANPRLTIESHTHVSEATALSARCPRCWRTYVLWWNWYGDNYLEIPTVNELKDYTSDVFIEIEDDRNLCRTVFMDIWRWKMVAKLKDDILSTWDINCPK